MQFTNQPTVEKNMKVEKFIGEGSTAKVYEAIDSTTNQKFAVKVFSNKFRSAKAKNIFQIQSEMMKDLIHPNICKVEGVFQGLFLMQKDEMIVGNSLILELAEEGSLLKAVRDNKLSVVEKITIVTQLFSAIQYLHDEMKMAHNDIKLDNVTLAKGQAVKLIDFSSATKKGFMEEETIGKLGTNGYMAPELLNESVNYADIDRQKCDVFSLGVLIMTLFIGKSPFVKPNEFDYFYSDIVSQNFDSFWEKHAESFESLKNNEDFNFKAFQQLINSMICFDPKQRKTISTLAFSSFFNLIKH